MLEKKYLLIKLSAIDFDDLTFRLHQSIDVSSLIQSIRAVGMINPPHLQEKGDGFRIVAGFKRLEALKALKIKECDALVFDSRESELEIFLLAVRERLSNDRLDPIELSVFIQKLQDFFGVDKEKIIKTYLPLAGYGRNPRVYELYSRLHELSKAWQKLVREEQTPIDLVNEMLDRTEEERDAFLNLFLILRLGKNRQREFVLLFSDVARILQQSVGQLVSSAFVQEIINEEKLTPSQKADRLKQWLWRKRYPRYAEALEAFDALIKEQKLPDGLYIQPPPFFEGDRFSAAFQFSSEKEFQNYTAALNKLLGSGDVEKIINMP